MTFWVVEMKNFLDCKTVLIVAYSSTRKQSNERSGRKLKTESETERARPVFFLSPHMPYGRVTLARFALKTLTPRLTNFFTDFEKNTDWFAV